MTNSVSHILAYNIAMHLSRGHKDIFFAVHTLRPGDGQRSAGWRKVSREVQLTSR